MKLKSYSKIKRRNANNNGQLTFDFLFDNEPIPECADYLLQMINLDGKKFRRKEELAREYIHQLKLWRAKNPAKDVLDIVPPNWIDYVKQNLI